MAVESYGLMRIHAQRQGEDGSAGGFALPEIGREWRVGRTLRVSRNETSYGLRGFTRMIQRRVDAKAQRRKEEKNGEAPYRRAEKRSVCISALRCFASLRLGVDLYTRIHHEEHEENEEGRRIGIVPSVFHFGSSWWNQVCIGRELPIARIYADDTEKS
jgi:hypothetical protein